MMGQNLYGYDWTLPFVKGGAYARAISPQTAISLARENHAFIEYDYTAQAPFFYYRDAHKNSMSSGLKMQDPSRQSSICSRS